MSLNRFQLSYLLYFIASTQNTLITQKIKHQVDSFVFIKTLSQYRIMEMNIFDKALSGNISILSAIQLVKINHSIYLETYSNKTKQFCKPDLKSFGNIVSFEILEDENNEMLNGIVFNSNIVSKPIYCYFNEVEIDNKLYYFLFQNKIGFYISINKKTSSNYSLKFYESLLTKKFFRLEAVELLKQEFNEKVEGVSNNVKKLLLNSSKTPENEIFCSSFCNFQFSYYCFDTFETKTNDSKDVLWKSLIVSEKQKFIRILDVSISEFISSDGKSDFLPTLLQKYCVANGKKIDMLPEKNNFYVTMNLLEASEPRRLCNLFSKIKESQKTKSLYKDLVTIQRRSVPQFIEPCGRAPKNGEPKRFYQNLLFWNFLFQLGLTILFSALFLYSKLNFVQYLPIAKSTKNSNGSRQKLRRTLSKQEGSGKESGSEAIGNSIPSSEERRTSPSDVRKLIGQFQEEYSKDSEIFLESFKKAFYKYKRWLFKREKTNFYGHHICFYLASFQEDCIETFVLEFLVGWIDKTRTISFPEVESKGINNFHNEKLRNYVFNFLCRLGRNGDYRVREFSFSNKNYSASVRKLAKVCEGIDYWVHWNSSVSKKVGSMKKTAVLFFVERLFLANLGVVSRDYIIMNRRKEEISSANVDSAILIIRSMFCNIGIDNVPYYTKLKQVQKVMSTRKREVFMGRGMIQMVD